MIEAYIIIIITFLIVTLTLSCLNRDFKLKTREKKIQTIIEAIILALLLTLLFIH